MTSEESARELAHTLHIRCTAFVKSEGQYHGSTCNKVTAELLRLESERDAALAEARRQGREEGRREAFREACEVIMKEAERFIALCEASPGDEGLRGREAGVHNAMAVVLRVACPGATDAEDAIERLAALPGTPK
jgi:hypothetical protein